MALSPGTLERMLECSVCMDTYKDPRILPICGHHYCLECLEGIAARHPRNLVICPACRAESALPLESVAALPRALIVNELREQLASGGEAQPDISDLATPQVTVDEARPVPETETSIKCDSCQVDATHHCYHCKQAMCIKCHSKHQGVALFLDHKTEVNTKHTSTIYHMLIPTIPIKCYSDIFCTAVRS